MPLTKEKEDQIIKAADAGAANCNESEAWGYADGYVDGATTEAEKASVLVSALESIRDGFDHESDAHKYNNPGACPVCIAEKALSQYKKD